MITNKLLAYIEREEGKRNKPYFCPAGKLTVGVGHNIDDNGLPFEIAKRLARDGHLKDDDIKVLLVTDIENAINACKRIYGQVFDSLTEARQAALVGMAFQLGERGLSRFINTNRMIKAGEFSEAAKNMKQSKWFRQTTARAERAIRMVETGDWV